MPKVPRCREAYLKYALPPNRGDVDVAKRLRQSQIPGFAAALKVARYSTVSRNPGDPLFNGDSLYGLPAAGDVIVRRPSSVQGPKNTSAIGRRCGLRPVSARLEHSQVSTSSLAPRCYRLQVRCVIVDDRLLKPQPCRLAASELP